MNSATQSNVVPFPSKAKPRPVLQVPTSDLIVKLWGQLHERIRAHHNNPCPHNERMMASARARYIAACIAENCGT